MLNWVHSILALLLLLLITGGCQLSVTDEQTIGTQQPRWSILNDDSWDSATESPLHPATLNLCAETSVPTGLFAFVDVNVLTMENADVLLNQTVIVDNGQIVALGSTALVDVPAEAVLIAGKGKYLMPGLADMHVHLQEEEHLLLLIANGVTTVRNMAGTPLQLQWRNEVCTGARLGPTINTAGPIVDGLPRDFDLPNQADTPQGAEAIVAAQHEQGYDFIKVYDWLSPSAHSFIMEAAERYDMSVTGHVPDAMSLLHVLQSGQRSIEHLEGYCGVYADELPALISATVSSGVWNCPTLVAIQPIMSANEDDEALYDLGKLADYMPDQTVKRWYAPDDFAERVYCHGTVREQHRQIVALLHEAGALLMLGTDAPRPYGVPGFAVHQELKNLVDAGLSPYEALQIATVNAALFQEQLSEVGRVTVGKRADLLLLSANPLVDITNIRQIEGVMVRGHWLPPTALDGLLQNVATVNATYEIGENDD